MAVVAQSTSQLRTQQFAGTAAYAAPEQLQGKPRPASDQYALGIVVYEWLTGSCPFQGSYLEVASQQVLAPPPLRQKMPTIAPQIEQVVLTALAKDPAARFPSVRDFAVAFERAYQAGTVYSTQMLTMPTTPQPGSSGVSPAAGFAAPTEMATDQAPALASPAFLQSPDWTAGISPAGAIAPQGIQAVPQASPEALPSPRFPASPSHPKRRRHLFVWLALSTLAILLLSGGAVFLIHTISRLNTPPSSPTPTPTTTPKAKARALIFGPSLSNPCCCSAHLDTLFVKGDMALSSSDEMADFSRITSRWSLGTRFSRSMIFCQHNMAHAPRRKPHVSPRQGTWQHHATESLAFSVKRTPEVTRRYCPGGGTTPSWCMRLMMSITIRLFLHWPATQ